MNSPTRFVEFCRWVFRVQRRVTPENALRIALDECQLIGYTDLEPTVVSEGVFCYRITVGDSANAPLILISVSTGKIISRQGPSLR